MINSISPSQNFKGNLMIVDKFGKKVDAQTQRSILSQLGATVQDLKVLIAKKNFDLFVSKGATDYINVNANKSYTGVLRRDINFYSLHKSTLDKIVQVAQTSIQEYEKFLQKNV